MKARGIAVDATTSAGFVQRFVVVTPPATAPATIEFVTLYEGGDGGGKSTKPGNVRLRLKTLMSAIAGGTLTAAGISAPWMIPLGAWLVFESLWTAVRVDVSETEAGVLWALWLTRDELLTVPKGDIVRTVNRELRRIDRPQLTAAQVRDAVAKLREAGCIGDSRRDHDRYTLREWVEVKYR